MNPDERQNLIYSLNNITNSLAYHYEEPMNDDDVYTKIRNGHYEVRGQPPERPTKPEILSKRASDLTDEEIASLRAVKTKYEADTEAYKQAKADRANLQSKLYDKFAEDLACECGIDNKNLANTIYAEAWDRGHSSGLSDVATAYSDLARIAKTAMEISTILAPKPTEKDVSKALAKELRHLIKLLDGPLSNGDVQIPGLATLNGAKKALKEYDAK